MANLTVQDGAVTGITPNMQAAAGGGDTFDNNGNVLVEIANGSGSPITVTFDDPGSTTPPGATQFNPDVAVVVPAAGRRIVGPLPPYRFNNAQGRVAMTYSGVTSLTIGLYRTRT